MSAARAGKPTREAHVCIIGAGISGCRCADILLSHGFKVTILEARDRIGGRIHFSDELGYRVDMGPSWIHAYADSEEPHAIYKLAKDTNTPLRCWNKEQMVYDASGKVLSNEITSRLSKLLWDIIETAFDFSATAKGSPNGQTIPSYESLRDFISKKADELLQDPLDRRLLVQMSEMFGAYIGEPVSKQSLRFAWMEQCCGGEEMYVESDYANILHRAAKPALEEAAIFLNSYVTSIETSTSRTSDIQVKITTSKGQIVAADEVVVTTPLGWLKRNTHVFHPDLPARLIDAFANISLSHLEKVYVTFPQAFWVSDGAKNDFPGYVTWLSPDYAQDTNPECWPQEIWDVSTSEPPYNHPALLFYLYGDCSRHVVTAIHGKSQDEQFSFLMKFFQPYYSRLPNYDATDDNCHPRAILATQWLKDELSGFASYCNFQVGVEEADQDVLAIRQGCPERRLWFCGEHTAPFEQCGTVTGAYISGESIAERIAELYEATTGSQDVENILDATDRHIVP